MTLIYIDGEDMLSPSQCSLEVSSEEEGKQIIQQLKDNGESIISYWFK